MVENALKRQQSCLAFALKLNRPPRSTFVLGYFPMLLLPLLLRRASLKGTNWWAIYCLWYCDLYLAATPLPLRYAAGTPDTTHVDHHCFRSWAKRVDCSYEHWPVSFPHTSSFGTCFCDYVLALKANAAALALVGGYHRQGCACPSWWCSVATDWNQSSWEWRKSRDEVQGHPCWNHCCHWEAASSARVADSE